MENKLTQALVNMLKQSKAELITLNDKIKELKADAKVMASALQEYIKKAEDMTEAKSETADQEIQKSIGNDTLPVELEEELIDAFTNISPDVGGVFGDKLGELRLQSENGEISLLDAVKAILDALRTIPTIENTAAAPAPEERKTAGLSMMNDIFRPVNAMQKQAAERKVDEYITTIIK